MPGGQRRDATDFHFALPAMDRYLCAVYRRLGMNLPRTAQQHEFASRIPEDQLQPGDLVFFARMLAFLLVFGLVGGRILAAIWAMCSPRDAHHRRHTPGRDRIALPPDPTGRPQ